MTEEIRGEVEMDINAYFQKVINWSLSSGLHIILVLILTLVALKAAKALSTRLVEFAVRQKREPEFEKRAQTLGLILRYATVFAVLIVATITVLRVFGIEIGPILPAAGITGHA
jgi:small conductance mechanosensitive channel